MKADNLVRARKLLAVAPLAPEPDNIAAEPPTPLKPCPCCGSAMRIIEVFKAGEPARHRPAAMPAARGQARDGAVIRNPLQFRTSPSQVQFVHRGGKSRACQWGRGFSRSETAERSRVSAESSVTSARACRSGFSKSPVSRVTETSAINTPRSVGCCRCAKSRTAMACPDGPVELTRAPAAAAPTAAHAAGGTLSMTSRSVARSSVSPRLRWRAHPSGGGHTPATACSGSAVQAGSSKTLFGQGRP
jgi:hypothetical protein